MNYYDILEVSATASPEVVRAAYKSLIQRYHPDRNPGDLRAAERSRSVVEAYQVLSDPTRRTEYDIELKRQRDSQATLRSRTASGLAMASTSPEAKKDSHFFFWSVIVLIALALWYVWPDSGKQRLPAIGGSMETAAASLLDPTPPASPQRGGDAPPGRTIPSYIEDLKVNLQSPTDAVERGTQHVLTIEKIGVVVGDFDPDKFIAFLIENNEYIARKLAERLSRADYGKLSKDSGDRYLKRVILDSIGEITKTEGPGMLPGGASPAHYGAVEILLPGSFSITSQQANELTVHTWTVAR